MRITFLLFFLAFIVNCARSQEASMNEQYYIDKMSSNIQQASIWIVEHGIEVYARSGKDAINRKMMDEWACQSWVFPAVGTERHIAIFQIKGRGIYYDIQCLNRLITGSAIFEYWHIMVTGKDWAGVNKRCQFLITQTDAINGVRKIIHQSDKFFSEYKINKTTLIKLPLDDLQLLYDLKAWQFPECFPDSDLKNWEIRIAQGNYMRVPGEAGRSRTGAGRGQALLLAVPTEPTTTNSSTEKKQPNTRGGVLLISPTTTQQPTNQTESKNSQ